MKYSFCESTYATGESSWHIRELTDVGQRLGGGIDTPSLCGKVKPPWGWDLKVNMSKHHLGHGCPKCKELYDESLRKS